MCLFSSHCFYVFSEIESKFVILGRRWWQRWLGDNDEEGLKELSSRVRENLQRKSIGLLDRTRIRFVDNAHLFEIRSGSPGVFSRHV